MTGLDGVEAGAVAAPSGLPTGLSPNFLAYVVGPVALVVLVVLRPLRARRRTRFGLRGVIIGTALLGLLAERWADAPRGSVRLHASRRAARVGGDLRHLYERLGSGAGNGVRVLRASPTSSRSGAGAWRAALGWSLAGCAVGQVLVLVGWAPSFLTGSQAQTIGGLGAFVFAIAIRMAGAILEYKERAEAQARRTDERSRRPRETTRSAARRTTARWSRTRPKEFSRSVPTAAIGSFNAAAEAMFGWTASEIVGQPVATIVTPELHGALDQFLERYQEIGRSRGPAPRGRDHRRAPRRQPCSR